MWQAVQDEQKTGGQQAKDYYIKTSVITDKRQRNRFLASGVIYRNEKIRDYMNQVKSDIDKGITAYKLDLTVFSRDQWTVEAKRFEFSSIRCKK